MPALSRSAAQKTDPVPISIGLIRAVQHPKLAEFKAVETCTVVSGVDRLSGINKIKTDFPGHVTVGTVVSLPAV